MIVAPYFRGLYFPGEQMLAALVVTVLAGFRWMQRLREGDHDLSRGPLDVTIWALVAAYTVSLTVAAQPRAGVQELVKAAMYAAVYWLVQDVARTRTAVRGLLHALLAAGFYVATLGVAAAAGQFNLQDAILGGRLASTFQYPNTLAAYLSVTFVVGITLWQTARSAWERAWTAAASYACLLALVFTYSRGGWLVLALVVAILWLLQPAGRRLQAVAGMAWLGAVFLPFGLLFGRWFAAGASGAKLWLAYLGGLPLAAAGAWAITAFMGSSVRLRVATFLAAVGVVAVGVVYVAVHPAVLPASLMTRLQDINLETMSAWERIQWSRDALRMIADRPLLGGGGGAWEALYHGYQSYNYYSTQVHNHFVQIWLEVGTVGFLIWLGIWVTMALSAWRAVRAAGDADDRSLVIGAAIAAAALGLHSLIDFNLALSAVAMTLWALFGVVRACEKIATGYYEEGRRRLKEAGYALWPRVAVYGGSGLALLVILSLYAGYWQGQLGAVALRRGDLAAAARHFDRALSLDPLTASFYFDRAKIHEAENPDDPRALATARALMEKGLRLDRYDANLHTLYGAFLLRHGVADEGLAALQRATELHPFATERWKNLARAEWLVGIDMVRRATEEGQDGRAADAALLAQARGHLEAALAIPGKIEELRARVPERVRSAPWAPEVTPEIALYAGQSAVILGRWTEAEQYLAVAGQAQDEKLRAEALMWLAAVYQRTGRPEQAEQTVQQALSLNPELDPVYRDLLVLLERLAGVFG